MYIIYTVNQTMHALWVKTNPITVKVSEGNISLAFPPLPHPPEQSVSTFSCSFWFDLRISR